MKRLSLFLLFLPLWAVHYQHFTEDELSIHLLEVDPMLYDIVPVRALDNGVGKESLSSLVQRHGAIAGINGGFFQVEGRLAGLPKGVLRIDHQWYAIPYKYRGAILWDKESVEIKRLFANCSITVDGKTIPITGINRQRRPGEIVVYLPTFHRTTLTDPNGWEVTVKNGVVIETRYGGSSPIPEDGFIISTDQEFVLAKGAPVSLNIPLPQTQHIVGGVPILIENGVLVEDHSAEQAIPTFFLPHARTAVGIRPNGIWLFVVVDHPGMTIDQLGRFMQRLGCSFALNLDGGKSSTMVIKEEVVNQPKIGERPGSDAILLRERSQSAIKFSYETHLPTQ